MPNLEQNLFSPLSQWTHENNWKILGNLNIQIWHVQRVMACTIYMAWSLSLYHKDKDMHADMSSKLFQSKWEWLVSMIQGQETSTKELAKLFWPSVNPTSNFYKSVTKILAKIPLKKFRAKISMTNRRGTCLKRALL